VTPEYFEVVVVGAGVMGSATLHHLARKGVRVCGIEQFRAGHDHGSSHGESRIIRMAYYLHADYVPLLHRAYALWRDLESETGRKLLHMTGLVCFGDPGESFIQGLERCYGEHYLPHERMTPDEAMKRFPAFHIPDNASVYYDPLGGYLNADECVRAQIDSARLNGATLYEGEPMISWEPSADGVIVRTASRKIHAGRLVLTTGPWIVPEFSRLGVNLRAKRKALFWYHITKPKRFSGGPCFIARSGSQDFYGFPSIDGKTIKAAEDSGGQWIDDLSSVDRSFNPDDETSLRAFLDRTFPGMIIERAATKTCIYTVSPDKHFILDFHPEHPQVILASCCSGHGFKFGCAIGEILSRAARKGVLPDGIDFLRLARLPLSVAA
jgi:sarcosine oxidase